MERPRCGPGFDWPSFGFGPRETPYAGTMRVDRFDILISLGLLLVSAAIYAPTAQFEFLAFDDDRYVTRNALVQEGLSPDTIRRSFTEFHSSNWHPLTWISHALDVQLFGAAAGAHHAVSVGLHALAACLLLQGAQAASIHDDA